MNEKQLTYLMGGLIAILVAFVAIDFISHKRWEQVKPRSDSNWKWEDNWSDPSFRPIQPILPNPNPQPNQRPQVQPIPPDAVMVMGDYDAALASSKQTGRPVLIFFEATWCKWCKKMKAETLVDTSVQQALRPFILVYVDTDKNRAIAQRFGVSGIPAYVITNASQEKLNFGNGFMDAKTFVAWLNNRKG
jgi:thiol:disulfide interchange protein